MRKSLVILATTGTILLFPAAAAHAQAPTALRGTSISAATTPSVPAVPNVTTNDKGDKTGLWGLLGLLGLAGLAKRRVADTDRNDHV